MARFYMVPNIGSGQVGEFLTYSTEILRANGVSHQVPINILKELAWITKGPS